MHGCMGLLGDTGIFIFAFGRRVVRKPVTEAANEVDKPKVVHGETAPDDDSIPACLRRCEQCGEPSDPNKGAVTPRDFGGIQHWLHERCDFEF